MTLIGAARRNGARNIACEGAVAHIWMMSDGEWKPLDLGNEGCVLGPGGSFSAGALLPVPADLAPRLSIRPIHGAQEDAWALLASPSARPLVNGLPLHHGIVVLSDRDEIRHAPGSDGTPVYFSTERPAVVVPYSPAGRLGLCPRCKQAMAPGEDGVRCPGCGVWHHSTAALPCWTYGDRCAACDHPTAIEAGFRWTPEVL